MCQIIRFIAVSFAALVIAGCQQSNVNLNDNTPPTASINVKADGGTWQNSVSDNHEVTMSAVEGLGEVTCVAEDPDGVKEVRLSFSASNTGGCNVNGTVFTGYSPRFTAAQPRSSKCSLGHRDRSQPSFRWSASTCQRHSRVHPTAVSECPMAEQLLPLAGLPTGVGSRPRPKSGSSCSSSGFKPRIFKAFKILTTAALIVLGLVRRSTPFDSIARHGVDSCPRKGPPVIDGPIAQAFAVLLVVCS